MLTGIPLDIQHVGSTAIPGLSAKPILDIDIIIEKPALLTEISLRLEKAGYISRGDQGIPGRFAFRQQSVITPMSPGQQTWMEHHLYVCYADSLALKNHLLLKDALLRDKDLVMQYAVLKERLSGQRDISREEYTRQKTAFILGVLQQEGLGDVELSQIRAANT